MATDPFNPFNQDIHVSDSSLQNSQVSQAARDSIQNQSNIQNNTGSVTNNFQSIVNTFLPPLPVVKEALVNTSKLFRQILPAARHDGSSDVVEFDDDDYLTAVEWIAHQMHEMSKLAKADFSYRTHATEKTIQLQNDRFLWEKAIVEQNLTIIRNFQAATLEQKRSELQIQADMHYLPLQISRDDVLSLLHRESGKFVIIPSSPKITSDLQIFQSLNQEISYELKKFIEKYYSSGVKISPIGYKNIFKGPIEQAHAQKIGEFLSPIPTLIFHSEITYQKVFIWVTITSSVMPSVELHNLGSDCHPNFPQETFPLEPLNWMTLKRVLKCQGKDPEETNQDILDLITSIHTVVAICFSDLYCLSLNPYHDLKLFDFLEDSRFSSILKAWTEPLQTYLIDIQKRIQEELDKLSESKVEQSSLTYSPSYSNFDSDDFGYALLIVCGLGIMFLFTMCSQQSPKVAGDNTGAQNSMEQQTNISIASYARIVQRASVREKASENSRLLAEAEVGDIATVQEIYGSWIRLKFKSGVDGWVHEQTIEFLR